MEEFSLRRNGSVKRLLTADWELSKRESFREAEERKVTVHVQKRARR